MVTKYVEKCVQIVAAKRSEMEITSAVVVDSGIRHLKILDDFKLAPARSRSRTKVRADSRCLPTADYISLPIVAHLTFLFAVRSTTSSFFQTADAVLENDLYVQYLPSPIIIGDGNGDADINICPKTNRDGQYANSVHRLDRYLFSVY